VTLGRTLEWSNKWDCT